MTDLNNIPPAVYALLGTFIGAIIGAGASIIVMTIQKHYEDKRSFRDAFINAGIKNWEGARDFLTKLSGMGQAGELMPLDLFIIHQSKIIELINEDRLSDESLRKAVEETRKFAKIFSEIEKKS